MLAPHPRHVNAVYYPSVHTVYNSNLRDSAHVMAVNGDHVPAVRFVTLRGIFGHGELCHLVKGHRVSIIHDDQIVQLLVRREGRGFSTYTLLQHGNCGDIDPQGKAYVCMYGSPRSMRGMFMSTSWMLYLSYFVDDLFHRSIDQITVRVMPLFKNGSGKIF